MKNQQMVENVEDVELGFVMSIYTGIGTALREDNGRKRHIERSN